jgi:hypothetical protein
MKSYLSCFVSLALLAALPCARLQQAHVQSIQLPLGPIQSDVRVLPSDQSPITVRYASRFNADGI